MNACLSVWGVSTLPIPAWRATRRTEIGGDEQGPELVAIQGDRVRLEIDGLEPGGLGQLRSQQLSGTST